MDEPKIVFESVKVEIAKLSLKKDDVLVIKVPVRFIEDAKEGLSPTLKKLPFKTLILPKGLTDLEVVSCDENVNPE